MLRLLILLMAVGAVLYGLTVLTPQSEISRVVTETLESGKPLEKLKSEWQAMQSRLGRDAKPTNTSDVTPPDFGMAPPAPAVDSVLRDVPVDGEGTDSSPETTHVRHRDQYTDDDVLAVNRESTRIFQRIEQLVKEEWED